MYTHRRSLLHFSDIELSVRSRERARTVIISECLRFVCPFQYLCKYKTHWVPCCYFIFLFIVRLTTLSPFSYFFSNFDIFHVNNFFYWSIFFAHSLAHSVLIWPLSHVEHFACCGPFFFSPVVPFRLGVFLQQWLTFFTPSQHFVWNLPAVAVLHFILMK